MNATHSVKTFGAAAVLAAGLGWAVFGSGAGVAHADVPDISFQTPSGNIECRVGATSAVCDIWDFTYLPPTPQPWEQVPTPCAYSGVDIHFFIYPGDQPGGYCETDWGHYARGLQTLDYGQTRSVGVMTCDSEPSGVTCTDSSSGHFFRVSRESYDLG